MSTNQPLTTTTKKKKAAGKAIDWVSFFLFIDTNDLVCSQEPARPITTSSISRRFNLFIESMVDSICPRTMRTCLSLENKLLCGFVCVHSIRAARLFDAKHLIEFLAKKGGNERMKSFWLTDPSR